MLELDLLLERFLRGGLDALDDRELDGLERLLEAPDQDILAWLGGARDPDRPDIARVVRVMRTFVSQGTSPGATEHPRGSVT